MDKWYYIGVGIFLVCISISFGFTEYQTGQCRIEALKAGKSAEDIVKICGK